MIKLCRVEGIDRTNTPLFDNFQEQYDYFDEKVVLEYDTFFPPLFSKEMEITADTDLIRSGANYVILEMVFSSAHLAGNRYFYFITDMTYISENTYRLTLEMDTIQTYMFDVKYHSGNIKRRLINRWENGSINRKYIRENYSNDIMIKKNFIKVKQVPEYDSGLIIFKLPSDTNYLSASPTSLVQYENSSLIGVGFKTLNDGTTLLICPACVFSTNFIKKYSQIAFERPESTMYCRLYDAVITIRKLLENPKLIDAYYLPYNPFSNIVITTRVDTENNWLYIKYTRETDGFGLGYPEETALSDNGFPIYFGIKPTILVDTYLHNFNFNRNTEINKPFNTFYVPQLIDENYIEYKFGEKNENTGYPLHTLLTPELLGYYTIDVFTGFRNYRLVKATPTYNDIYNTLKVVSSKEQITIYNDAWKTYASQNMGSLTLGRAFNIGNNIYEYSKLRPTPVRNKISSKQKDFIVNDFGDTATNMSVNDINLKFTPDTLGQGNTMTTDVLTNSLDVSYQYSECTNIEDIAKIYESKGYAVNEIITNSPLDNLTRYYYNYFEIDDLDISGDILIPFDHLDNIKERWSSGIRLYTMKHLPSDMELGDVCKYDNVELNAITE